MRDSDLGGHGVGEAGGGHDLGGRDREPRDTGPGEHVSVFGVAPAEERTGSAAEETAVPADDLLGDPTAGAIQPHVPAAAGAAAQGGDHASGDHAGGDHASGDHASGAGRTGGDRAGWARVAAASRRRGQPSAAGSANPGDPRADRQQG